MSFFTHRSSLQASSLVLERRASLVERDLIQQYRAVQALFTAQPAPIRFFLLDQAQTLGEALIHEKTASGFSLPHRVVCVEGAGQLEPIPASFVWQKLDGWKDRINRIPLLEVLDRRLGELERESPPAVAAGAALLRYTTARHLLRYLLPPLDSIGLVGVGSWLSLETAEQDDSDPGTVLVDCRWAPVQPFVEIFRTVYRLAAYISVDEEYRQKHFRLLGRWIDQCRALAAYETEVLVQELRVRAEGSALNRGLRLSLPYFDDQQLEMRLYDFMVIPLGRIPFDPDLLVAAARAEQSKVAEDARLSSTTRLHLIAELRIIERDFQRWSHPNKLSGSI